MFTSPEYWRKAGIFYEIKKYKFFTFKNCWKHLKLDRAHVKTLMTISLYFDDIWWYLMTSWDNKWVNSAELAWQIKSWNCYINSSSTCHQHVIKSSWTCLRLVIKLLVINLSATRLQLLINSSLTRH
jgi:hypothetical protein